MRNAKVRIKIASLFEFCLFKIQAAKAAAPRISKDIRQTKVCL